MQKLDVYTLAQRLRKMSTQLTVVADRLLIERKRADDAVCRYNSLHFIHTEMCKEWMPETHKDL